MMPVQFSAALARILTRLLKRCSFRCGRGGATSASAPGLIGLALPIADSPGLALVTVPKQFHFHLVRLEGRECR
jgi:hypothetical protein